MKNRILKFIACLLALLMMISTGVVSVFADENAVDTTATDTAVDTAAPPAEGEEAPTEGEEAPAEGEEPPAEGEEAPAEDEEYDEDVVPVLTNEEALARCELVAENENLAMYLDREFERVGVLVKESGYIHWSNAVNALSDTATDKNSLRQNRLSNLGLRYGNATDLIHPNAWLYSYRQSTSKENTEYEIEDNGVKITYNYSSAKADVPVHFILGEDYFEIKVITKEIKEKSGYKETEEEDQEAKSDVIVVTDLAISPFMSAATTEDSGYMLVPDGSGAIIRLNNAKGVYNNFKQDIYGRDITKVRENAPDATEASYLPVMAMVKENNGLVMIATEGDTFAQAHAAVSGSKTDQSSYNYCYFSFTLRSADDYYMTGDSSSIIMFEKGDGKIKVPEIAVRYYPITSDSEEVQLGEIADVYRNYLIEEKGLTKKTEANSAPMFVDYYGGTLKSKSILGIPIALKTAYTTFDEAVEITGALKDAGVPDMLINFNDWSNSSMSGKIDTGSSVAGVLGGKSDMKKYNNFLNENGYDSYFTVTGYTFTSNGNGFTTLFNTAYRVSKSYSRQYSYNIAFGTPDPGVAPALLSPKSIAKLSDKVSKNLGKLDNITGAGLGEISSTLWSDFSKKNLTNRDETAGYIIDYYTAVKESTGKIIADAPNAYLLPYVDVINNLTLQSSQFKITDLDVPFYQMVIHGYIPYATEALNGVADSGELFLRAIASGSNIHFDFIHEEAIELVNTDYLNLYYANYEGWVEYAAQTAKLANEILSKVSDAVITNYVVDGDEITTTYDNGIKTVVNLETGTITCDGKTYVYADYVQEGGAE